MTREQALRHIHFMFHTPHTFDRTCIESPGLNSLDLSRFTFERYCLGIWGYHGHSRKFRILRHSGALGNRHELELMRQTTLHSPYRKKVSQSTCTAVTTSSTEHLSTLLPYCCHFCFFKYLEDSGSISYVRKSNQRSGNPLSGGTRLRFMARCRRLTRNPNATMLVCCGVSAPGAEGHVSATGWGQPDFWLGKEAPGEE